MSPAPGHQNFFAASAISIEVSSCLMLASVATKLTVLWNTPRFLYTITVFLTFESGLMLYTPAVLGRRG
jgi:hypothetical protein